MLNTADARVMLADIPLVRLRAGLPEPLLAGNANYCDTVNAAQMQIGASLEFDLPNKIAILGGKCIELPPLLLAFLLWMARLRKEEKSIRPDDEMIEPYLAVYREVADESLDYEKSRDTLLKDPDFAQYFKEKNAKLKRLLKARLGLYADDYLIIKVGIRGESSYHLRLNPADISV